LAGALPRGASLWSVLTKVDRAFWNDVTRPPSHSPPQTLMGFATAQTILGPSAWKKRRSKLDGSAIPFNAEKQFLKFEWRIEGEDTLESSKYGQFPFPVDGIPYSAKRFARTAQNRESSATRWNCSANGRQNAAESAKMARDLKNSLLFSLFSGNARARRWFER